MVRKEYSKDEIRIPHTSDNSIQFQREHKILQRLYVCGGPIYET